MTHRTTEQDIGGFTESQINFMQCAAIYRDAAEYQLGILPKAECKIEARIIRGQIDYFLNKAAECVELAK